MNVVVAESPAMRKTCARGLEMPKVLACAPGPVNENVQENTPKSIEMALVILENVVFSKSPVSKSSFQALVYI